MLFQDLKITEVIAFKELPDAISDGCILDLHVQQEDRPLLKHPKTRLARNCQGTLVNCMECKTPLGEPGERINMTLNVEYRAPLPRAILTDIEAISFGRIVLQVQYYQYFKSRYPNAQFFGHEQLALVAVTDGTEVVGAIRGVVMNNALKDVAYPQGFGDDGPVMAS